MKREGEGLGWYIRHMGHMGGKEDWLEGGNGGGGEDERAYGEGRGKRIDGLHEDFGGRPAM